MAYRIAINGYGRIGRCVLRSIFERNDTESIEIAAINQPGTLDSIALATRYDSNHGVFDKPVQAGENWLEVSGKRIPVLPGLTAGEDLPWQALGVDLVLECSGQPANRSLAEGHLDAGAKQLLFSNPATKDVDATLICGFNAHTLRADDRILSAGSCTTNCLIPLLASIEQRFGILHGGTTTLHAAMNDQPVSDTLGMGRSALNAMVPVQTALAAGIDRLLPSLAGKLECTHLRVPTTNVSAMDINLALAQPVTIEQLDEHFQQQATTDWKNIIDINHDPISSVDINHNPHSGILDARQTRIANGKFAKLFCWFDNEWGFSNRMVDLALRLAKTHC